MSAWGRRNLIRLGLRQDAVQRTNPDTPLFYQNPFAVLLAIEKALCLAAASAQVADEIVCTISTVWDAFCDG